MKNTDILLDKKVRQPRIDHGSEFENFTLDVLCKENGLVRISLMLGLLNKMVLLIEETTP